MSLAHAFAEAPPRLARKGRIRRFESTDIRTVARLHQRTWPHEIPRRQEAYDAYFSQVFLNHPDPDSRLSSLVYEDESGRVVGFLGVVPRRLSLRGQTFHAAHCSQFVVDPDGPVGLVAVAIARAFFDGPQDLSIADEAGESARKMWAGFGGTTALLMSLQWMRPLRPAGLALSFLRARPRLAPLATLARPLASATDALVTRVPWRTVQRRVSIAGHTDLSAADVVERMSEFVDDKTLRVEHDERTFQWLLDRAVQQSGGHRLLTAMVWDGAVLAGWYIASVTPDRVADVVQLVASPSAIDRVLDHLFARAWQEGAVAVSGRVEPRFMQTLSDQHCVFHQRGPSIVIHSRRPELVWALESGRACFSRLDGEWPLRFTGRETAREVW